MKLDAEAIQRMLAEDEFDLLRECPKSAPLTENERLVASFLEIVKFVEANDRLPDCNPADMAEFKLAARLSGIVESEEKRAALHEHDRLGLLKEPEPPSSIEDVLNSDDLGLLDDDLADIHTLRHVPKTLAKPDKVAQRRPCEDFAEFKPLFDTCHADLRTGRRKLIPWRNPSHIEVGKFFVQNGMLVYVAEVGELKNKQGAKAIDGRTRCVYDNGTEADLLLRSLARALYDGGRQVTEPEEVTRERIEAEPGTAMGSVYILRSKSKDPQVTSISDLHKIGSTSRSVESRIAGAEKDTTFMCSPVEIRAEYRLPAVAARKVETMLHDFFASARMDIWFEIADGQQASATEWFDVPLLLIDEAIELISAETLPNYQYDAKEQAIVLRP